MGFYNIINSLFKNIFATLKIIRKLFFMIIFVLIIVVLLENTCFAASYSYTKTIEITKFSQGTLLLADGSFVDYPYAITTDFIDLPAGDYTLTYSGGQKVFIAYYSLGGSYKGALVNWTSGEVNFTLSGSFSIRCCFAYPNNSAITPDDISNVALMYVSDPYIDYTESLDIINSNIGNGFNVIDNTLSDSNINLDNDLPTIEIQDITQTGFGGIFTKIRDAFTKEETDASVTFTIPFVNKTFTFSMDSIYGNFNLQPIKSILVPFWYFIVSLYIVKDIAKQLNKLKSGNIDNVANENVKEDLL